MKDLVIRVVNKIRLNIKSIIRRSVVEMVRGLCLGLLFSLVSCAATQASGIFDGGPDDVLNVSGSFTSEDTKDMSNMSDSELCLTIIGNWSETSKDLIDRNLDLTEENTRLKVGQPITVPVQEDAINYEELFMDCSKDYNSLSEKYVDELNAKDDEILKLKGIITELENDKEELKDRLLEQILKKS